MLTRHIIGYLPSLIIPALAAFAAIFCYTRLLSPEQYGLYILMLNSMALVNVVCFYWLQVSLPRLMPEAAKAGDDQQLFATAIIAFGIIAIALILITALFTLIASTSALVSLGFYVVALALTRALLSLRQMVHRSKLNFNRYNILECGQALLGFSIGFVLVYMFGWGARGVIAGMAAGMAAMLLVDYKAFLHLTLRHFSRPYFLELLRFGSPLVLSYGFAFILSTSDRFFIEHFYGMAQVGKYAAGYSLVDRIITHVFMIVTLPSFPLAIYALETGGLNMARKQTHTNGIAILLLALPACAGLMLASPMLATLLLGSEFRETAIKVMPWIAFAALLNGLSTHYFDHVFHLAKKPYLLLFTQGPAALLNVLLNLTLLPRYGYMGAVVATVSAYGLQLALSILIGRHAFATMFPFKQALQIICSTTLMAVVLSYWHFSNTIFGLGLFVVTGAAIYAASLFALNLLGIRSKLFSR